MKDYFISTIYLLKLNNILISLKDSLAGAATFQNVTKVYIGLSYVKNSERRIKYLNQISL